MADNDKNNFKELENFEASEKLKKKSLQATEGNVSAVKAFFNVLDLYISKFFDVFIHAAKDEGQHQNHRSDLSLGIGIIPNVIEKDKKGEFDNDENPDENEEDNLDNLSKEDDKKDID